ncbi:LysR family hydrogen peroxide-inducible transcriptional activator [Neobacillus niacini]|uniref:LysR family transcriptional regulator n=1 Tax=Neobacillus niacini TaxID=86668 RepID=UPI002785B1BA|nr:LysR family transcriptional regulator [Neobacillus niacini]MDQ1002652.1 LysR family hydrogen peroxide-inducible transcriptional activator [Neobacillus niacini]
MEPKILQYVIMLANEKNFSRAAEQLHVAQPSLSYQIIKLENQLGTQLFNRGHSEVQLTYAGKVFVEHALKIIDQFNQLKKEIDDVTDLHRGQLFIGSLATTGAYLLPKAIPVFKNKYPGIELVLLEDSTQNLELLVSRGQVEIGLLSMPVATKELEVETILEDEYFLAVPHTHPLAQSQEINLIDFKNESFILLKKGRAFRTETENLCKEAGFEPRVIFESINIMTCLSLVSTGIGIAFVPGMVINNTTSHEPLVYLRIKQVKKRTRNVVFAYKNGRYLSKAARSFIDIMKTVTLSNFDYS